MKISLKKIIREEFIKFLKENYEDVDYEYFNLEDEIKGNIFQEFLYKNNENFSRNIRWKLIPFPRLKKIWEDYMRMGIIRDTNGLNMIADIMINNALKIAIITKLCGHTSQSPEDDFEEYIGYYVNEQLNCITKQPATDTNQLEIPFDSPKSGYKEKKPVEQPEPCNTTIHQYLQEVYNNNYEEGMTREKIREILYENLKEKFYDYFVEDPKSGQAYISDYGYNALVNLSQEIHGTTNPDQRLVIMDKLLNVVHQRSDIAGWFVEGGSSALSQLSGYRDDKVDSNISGNYDMSDYH
jgi:hypothetical protein